MYADEHDNVLSLVSTNHAWDIWMDYKNWMKGYVGIKGVSSPEDKLFACPSDSFYYADAFAASLVSQSSHVQSNYNYSSYAFNAGNTRDDPPFTNTFPGIAGQKLTSVIKPARTVLVVETPALAPYSWHEPKQLAARATGINDSKSILSFVDGHVHYSKIHWDAEVAPNHFQAWHYDPPEGYDYQWSGN
jgi:hypothetical protein